MVVHIKHRIYSRDSKISTSTMKKNLCVESWRKSGNWPCSKIRQTETRSDIATLLRAGAESPALYLILKLKWKSHPVWLTDKYCDQLWMQYQKVAYFGLNFVYLWRQRKKICQQYFSVTNLTSLDPQAYSYRKNWVFSNQKFTMWIEERR